MAEATRIILKSRAEREECKRLRTIGKAIPDRYKGSRNEGRDDQNTKAQGADKISRAEGYGGLSLKCVNGLKIRWQNFVLQASTKEIMLHIFIFSCLTSHTTKPRESEGTRPENSKHRKSVILAHSADVGRLGPQT